MRKITSFILLILTSISYGQDITATLKAPSSIEPGKDLPVEITVNKAGVTGFIKYFQELPAGFTAADIDSKGGNFTYADNGAKIIWISPPADDQFTISYKITTPLSANTPISLGGKFSYVVGNERKTFDLLPQSVPIGKSGGSIAVKEQPKETVKPSEETKASPAETKTTEEKPIVKTSTPGENPKPAEPKKETPAVTPAVSKSPVSAAATTTAGRSYRVQIGAFSQKPKIDGVPEPSTVLLDNGMTKYFSGNFKTYEEAKKRKSEMLDKGFQGAFIVSFENGRIIK
ncbi:MAG TPA: hypothetical protein VF868_12475 [Bacteroidia bacterium]|jgi:cell division septation protein DedD